MHVVIFEGSRWPSFAPLSLTRPVFMLRSGMSTLLEKQVRYLKPDRLTLWVRPGLAEYCREVIAPTLRVPTAINQPLDDEPALLVSGRTLHFGQFEFPPHDAVVHDDGVVCFAYVKSPGLSPEDALLRTDDWVRLLDLPHMMPQSRMADYVWDLINWNEESLIEDWVSLPGRSETPPAGPYVMLHEESVRFGKAVHVQPGAVLDASRGPIVLADAVTIGANSVVQGPCYIGPHSQIMPLSQIGNNTTIGPMCRIGGIVNNSILSGYTSKPHEGHLGDSYLGEWINLGAGTTASSLKNTYGPITVKIGAQKIPTDRRLLGAIIGDHAKTAVGTRIMSGSYIGYCAMLAGSAIAPRFVPSFTFLTDKGQEKYDMEKAREVMNSFYQRRNRKWAEIDERMMHYAVETAEAVEKE